MIYIHSLKDLNPKTADIESTQFVRELKKNFSFPIDEQKFNSSLKGFFITQQDIDSLVPLIEKINNASEELRAIAQSKNPLYEMINIKRSLDMLGSLVSPLINCIAYAESMMKNKEEILSDFALIMNNLNKLDEYQKIGCNTRIQDIFKTILRNDGMFYNATAIVDEGEVETAKSLHESMGKGFIFHFTVEDELKRNDFSKIRERIPPEALQKNEELISSISEIKKGIDLLYDHNLRMIELALLLFAHLRIVQGG